MVRLQVIVCCIFSSFHSLSQPYQSGHFTTLDRRDVKAFIKFNPIQSGRLTSAGSVPGRIKIKTEQDSHPFELSADEIGGFVMSLDSFVIMKNIPVSETEYFKRDFVKVEAIGRLSLFIHSSQNPSGRFGTKVKKVYILLKRGTRKLISFHNHFQKDQFLELIADDRELLRKADRDWQWLDHLPNLIKKYNSHFIDANAKK